MDHETIPILIVGGGPVGLSTALFLARAGIPSLLVERHSGTALQPRARNISIRTMEIFRNVGLEEDIRVRGTMLNNCRDLIEVDTLAGTELRRVPLPGFADERIGQLSPTIMCECGQDQLEPLLVAAARRHDADLRFATELIAFEQDATGVTARIVEHQTGIARIVHARYMIAADGANSMIERMLAVPVTGPGTFEHLIGIYFRADLSDLIDKRWFIVCMIEHPEARGSLLPVNNRDLWQFNVSYAPEAGVTPADFTNERCIDLVRKAVGLPHLEVDILSALPWERAVRVAERFCVERVFLVGDAAHVMPPDGAFGMNAGIQDAQNLVWKLAAVLHSGAGPALLATYDAERRPVAKLTAEQARLRSDMSIVRLAARRSHEGSTGFIDDLTIILGYRYSSPAILSLEPGLFASSAGASPGDGSPGTRAPHVWLEQQGRRLSTLDLFGDRFVLLAGRDGEALCDAARVIAARLGLSLDAHRVGAEDDLVDLEERWCSAYGVAPQGAVLVRPDGFVGWRSERGETSPQQKLAWVLEGLLCRRPSL